MAYSLHWFLHIYIIAMVTAFVGVGVHEVNIPHGGI